MIIWQSELPPYVQRRKATFMIILAWSMGPAYLCTPRPTISAVAVAFLPSPILSSAFHAPKPKRQ